MKTRFTTLTVSPTIPLWKRAPECLVPDRPTRLKRRSSSSLRRKLETAWLSWSIGRTSCSSGVQRTRVRFVLGTLAVGPLVSEPREREPVMAPAVGGLRGSGESLVMSLTGSPIVSGSGEREVMNILGCTRAESRIRAVGAVTVTLNFSTCSSQP